MVDKIIKLSLIETNMVCGGVQELYKEEFACEGIPINSTVTTCYSVRPVKCYDNVKPSSQSNLGMAFGFLTSPRVILTVVAAILIGVYGAKWLPMRPRSYISNV